MRRRHALKPAGTARRGRRTGAMASRCRRSFADRDTRPCELLRRNLPTWMCNVPDSSTTHSGFVSAAPTRDRTVGLCRGIALPQPRGKSGRICVSANCAKTVTLSAAPRSPRASTSAFWSDGQGLGGPHAGRRQPVSMSRRSSSEFVRLGRRVAGIAPPNHLIMSFFQHLSMRSSGNERADSPRPQPGMTETCRTELARQKDARPDRHR